MATDAISLDFIAAQLGRVLDEQSAMRGELHEIRDEQRAIRIEFRRLADNQAGLLRLIDGLSSRMDRLADELSIGIKVEIGGLFANLETRLENFIASEIEARLVDRPH